MTEAARATAFDEFVNRCYPDLCRMAVLIVGDRDRAVEVVHDALARVQPGWEQRHRDRQVALSYVRRMMLSIAIDAARRRRVMNQRIPLLFERDAVDPDVAQQVTVWREVLALPAQQRAAIVLHYYYDLTVTAGADVLGCSEATFLTHLRRARKALATRLRYDDAATSERGRNR